MDAHARVTELLRQVPAPREHVTFVAHRDHDALDVREPRRDAEPVVVAVRHDQAAHHPRRRAPRRGPCGLSLALGVQELDLEHARKVLAELVARAHLERLAVAHHRFARQRILRAGKSLLCSLQADDNGDREHLHHEVLVDLVQHALGEGARVFACRVRSVPFLPEEFSGTQEEPGPQLPPNDVAPLVEEQRQVAIALQPFRHVFADDSLARGPDHHRLVEHPSSCHRDDGELRAEPLDVLGFAPEVGLGYEQRKVRVLRAARLDPEVELGLHAFPEAVPVRPDDHRSAHGTVLGQLGLAQHVLVPTREVVALRGQHRHAVRG
jgi:hypothetical protein